MSIMLTRRRGSSVFSKPQTTAARLKIQQQLRSYKQKFRLTPKTIEYPTPSLTQKLSVSQAKSIEKLQTKTRRSSLTNLLKSYDRNCEENIIQPMNTIDQQKLGLFRSGVYYRSKERARGVGVKKVSDQQLKAYFNWGPGNRDNERMLEKWHMKTQAIEIKIAPKTHRVFSSSVV